MTEALAVAPPTPAGSETVTVTGPPPETPLTTNVATWVPVLITTWPVITSVSPASSVPSPSASASKVMTPPGPVWVIVTGMPSSSTLNAYAGASSATVKVPVPPTGMVSVVGLRVIWYWPTITLEEATAPPSAGSRVALTVTGPGGLALSPLTGKV